MAVKRFELHLLAVLFFLSGASALVYQVVWLRMLALVFGVTVYAASAVLSSFMGGLALGAWLGGRLADRLKHPLRAFALLELGIGASALLVPMALGAVEDVYALIHARMPDRLASLTVVRMIGSGLVLLVPTTLMGASLPLLARHVSASGTPAARTGAMYAMNTAGGIVGTGLAGFVLIGGIGVTATTRLAVIVNLVVGLSALALSTITVGLFTQSLPSVSPVTTVLNDDRPVRELERAVLVVFALAGFAGLALEVVWFRVLVLFITATTYAFTTMLATVLLGIAIGSAISAARVKRSPDPVRSLAWIQIWTGVLVILSMAALAVTYRRGWRTSGMIQACGVAMLPATVLMGAAFPFGLAIWLRGREASVGGRVGLLYAVNVCGAVVGAVAGAFLLLPLVGSHASLLVLSSLYVGAGCLLTAAAQRPAFPRTAAIGFALFVVAALTLPDVYSAVLSRRYGNSERTVFRAEGVQTTATVHRQPSGRLVLYLDGLHQANDSPPMVRVHAEIGHLPMVLHPNPRRALVIGLGGGVTAGAVASHTATRTDIVELAGSVVSASRFFSHVNGNVVQRPNVRLRIDDGRNHLLLTRERYDVITADIIQPIHAGAGNLYSLEYFRLARRVLRRGGLMLQWIGQREEAHYRLIMRTFLEAFPHATLWVDANLLVGSLEPLTISRDAYERRLADPDVRFELAKVGLDTFAEVISKYTAGPEEMRRFLGDGPVLTDDRPLVEYHRSIRQGGRPVDVTTLSGDVRRHIQP